MNVLFNMLWFASSFMNDHDTQTSCDYMPVG